MSAENYIHKRKSVFKFLRGAALLCHTAAYGDYKVFSLLFQPLQRAYVSVCALLRVFPDAAGVENNGVGFSFLGRFLVAQTAHDAREFFRFVNVHLAAVSNYVIFLFFHVVPL